MNAHRAGALLISTFLLSLALNPSPSPFGPAKGTIPPYSFAPSLAPVFALGYGNALAVVHWMKLVAYIGGTPEEVRNMQYVALSLDRITRVSPRFEPAYYVAAVLLPWSTKSTSYSDFLLERAMMKLPNDWRWPYYRGFNAYWFDNRPEEAARYLKRAASLPGAPPIVASLAARMEAHRGRLETALRFLESLRENRQDKAIREQIEARIREIRTEIVLRAIERELRARGIPPAPPKELERRGIRLPSVLPDGGRVAFVNGRLVSSKTGKRFRLYRPPHKPGASHPAEASQ